MNARCVSCKNVFHTDRYGRQTCPHCGAEVLLRAPEEKPPATLPPPQGAGEAGAREVSGEPSAPGEVGGPFGSEPEAQVEFERTPWEERDRHGLVAAWFATLKQSLTDPVRMFERMPTGDARGAISYYWITAGLAFLFGGLWQAATVAAGFGGSFDPETLQLPPQYQEMFARYSPEQMAAMNASTAIASALFAPVVLFISAGIVHLGALVFGSGRKGFEATLRASAYAAGPMLLQAIPLCGQFLGVIGFFWYVTLVVIGMWKLHGGEAWRAAAAVIAPWFVFTCCVCCGLGSMAAMIFGAVGAAMGGPVATP